MNTVVRFVPTHYVEAVAGHELTMDAERAGRLYAEHDAFSGYVGDALAAVAGVVNMGHGVGKAWAVVTDVGRAHPMFLHRAVLANFARVIRARRYRRVEADVLAHFGAGRAWVQALGFGFEGIAWAAAPGGDHFARYALLPDLPTREVDPDGIAHVWHRGAEHLEVDGRLVPMIAGGYGTESIVGIILAAAAVAGTAVSAYSAYSSGQAQSNAARFNAKVAENQAQASRQAADAEANMKRQRYRAILSENQAAVAASGVDTGSGSPLLVMADNAAQAELDAQMTQWRGTVQQNALKSEASLNRYKAGYASQAGMVGAGATLLSGAASLGGRMYAGSSAPRAPSFGGVY